TPSRCLTPNPRFKPPICPGSNEPIERAPVRFEPRIVGTSGPVSAATGWKNLVRSSCGNGPTSDWALHSRKLQRLLAAELFAPHTDDDRQFCFWVFRRPLQPKRS